LARSAENDSDSYPEPVELNSSGLLLWSYRWKVLGDTQESSLKFWILLRM